MPNNGYKELCYATILESWKEETQLKNNEKSKLLTEIKAVEQQLTHTRNLLSSDKIAAEDFYIIKAGLNSKLETLENKLASTPQDKFTIDYLLKPEWMLFSTWNKSMMGLLKTKDR